MSDGEQISHLISMIHMECDSVHHATMASSGYLERLQKEIDSGGFAADQTLEVMMLEKSAQYLRDTAKAIEKVRLQLLSNYREKQKNIVLERAVSFTRSGGGIIA